MLRQLIPAMKKGAKVVINDYCLPEPGENNPWDERLIRYAYLSHVFLAY